MLLTLLLYIYFYFSYWIKVTHFAQNNIIRIIE